MAYFEPDGVLKILSDVPITDSQTIVFGSPESQLRYFNSKVKFNIDEMSYLAHDGVVSVELSPEQLKGCNYIMWRNPTQENITWFARISTPPVWVNSATTTDIHYTIDSFQTYMFNHTVQFAEMAREQLSESDWQKALINPFDPSIIELATPEPVAVGTQFEPDYELVSMSSNSKAGMSFFPTDAGIAHQRMLLILNMGWLTADDFNVSKWQETLTKSGATIKTPMLLNNFPNSLGFIWWKLTDVYTSRGWQTVLDFLTLYGLTSEIVGMYSVHESVVDSIGDVANPVDGDVISITPYKGYLHPKLSRSPFQYLRVTSPAGVSKEYQYEKFASMRNGGAGIEFKYFNLLNGNPVSYMAPVNYRRNIDDPDFSIDMSERIEYADMPQVGFNTDAYLTFLSSQYASAIAANDKANQMHTSYMESEEYQVNSMHSITGTKNMFTQLGHEMLKFAKGGITKFFTIDPSVDINGNATGISNPSAYAYGNAASAARQTQAAMELQKEQDAYNILNEATGKRDASPSGALSYAKQAYVADAYTPGGSSGYVPFQLGSGTPTWTFTKVALEENYSNRVVEYLNRYGCTSGRFGLPYVYQFMHGGEAPHWTIIDGHNAAYCKCAEVEVICDNQAASQAIAATYTSGTLFINGDDIGGDGNGTQA